MAQTRGEMLREKLQNLAVFLEDSGVSIDENVMSMISSSSDGAMASWINVNLRPFSELIKRRDKAFFAAMRQKLGVGTDSELTPEQSEKFFLYMQCFLSLTKA
jgi:hypothetical protein